ncbi:MULTISPECIES: hypothetical protein [unclassified Rhizobium]|uniref:hypothetical protein n=1 Tax=unclassified Rhizobium TaxID=2613769 RepID=UPI000BE96276|nr:MULTISPECIES: hypothetical protein [unclassified Rhizobium]MDF0664166.1 hypothetical protein [Rhizobium sp. BC49]PDS78096.1 hypothetical protein CO654_33515 [Rhizobium sp. L18]
MLDNARKQAKKKTAFDAWWSALLSTIRESNDVAFARRCFRAGHAVGSRPAKNKSKFRAGRFVVPVWAANSRNAAKEAVIQLDYRVANGGKRPPASGWKLTSVADDA